ncbi:MAG: WhiB family transcriptional regulator [Bifidobacteriaceae bacterium]|jgi:WhiB family redox-sensing transcriptional regulator|nr:WhiB family transcriptional regulator [Bifidobacteriaceae bacterium]
MWGLFENVDNTQDVNKIIKAFFTEQDTISQWREYALCSQTNPTAFFPEKGGSTKDAKNVCTNCVVKSECLEYALTNDIRFGIWGGKSERERRRFKKDQEISNIVEAS